MANLVPVKAHTRALDLKGLSFMTPEYGQKVLKSSTPEGLFARSMATGKDYNSAKYQTRVVGNVVKLYHYGTLIFAWDKSKGKPALTDQYGGYSVSDQGAIQKVLGILQTKERFYPSRAKTEGEGLAFLQGDKEVARAKRGGGEKLEGAPGYHSTDAWRGYEIPAFAVVGASDTGMYSDSPAPSDKVKAELDEVASRLRSAGIPAKVKTTESSNVFMVKRWLVVPPGKFGKAKEIADSLVPGTGYLHSPE